MQDVQTEEQLLSNCHQTVKYTLALTPPWTTPEHTDPSLRLDQNLCCLLSEKGTYSPDVVQHVSTQAGCCSNVGNKGELTVVCHTQVPCSLGGGYNRVVDGDSKVMDGRAFPWKEK